MNAVAPDKRVILPALGVTPRHAIASEDAMFNPTQVVIDAFVEELQATYQRSSRCCQSSQMRN
jgi:hypothetical protein